MAQFKFLAIPAEDYDALGIDNKTILETRITDDGKLIIRKVTDQEIEEFVCDGNCDSCPVANTDCDGECFGCPCYACCADSDYTQNKSDALSKSACKSHGERMQENTTERHDD